MEIIYFTPGQTVERGPPLVPYRPATPAGALRPYLEAHTRPGDLVIDLFCHSPTWIQEAVQAGRRAVGFNVNRATLLAASLGLETVERREVEAGFTRLAETRKGGETLQAFITGLYRTACVTCGATVVADAFIWERGEAAPVAKIYRCSACGDARPEGAPTDETDREAAARFEARGLSYWLLVDRAAAAGAPHRSRVERLVELYTPRNRAALSDLLLKSDGLSVTPPVRRVLDALLLDTFDRASSLRPPDPSVLRPRRLRRPARFVEENVWRRFERALEAWRKIDRNAIPLAPDLESLLGGEGGPAAYLAPLSARQAGRRLPPGGAPLVVVDPPRPDLVLWHLTALWSYWLWEETGGEPLLPFLSRRRLTWDWFWRGLQGALGAVAPLLSRDGRLVCPFSDEDPAALEAVTLAAVGAGYHLVGWGAQPPAVRLSWRRAGPPDAAPDAVDVQADALNRAVAERAAQASLEVLRARGEPTAWATLHDALYADLAASERLTPAAALPEAQGEPLALLTDAVRSALEGAPLRQLTNQPTDRPLWWLDEPQEREAAAPLSDRVELAVADILRDILAVTEIDLHRRVCARFPGATSPAAALVRLCLFSYGDEHAPGHWRLRAEDDLEARAAETDAVIADLSALGRRLGFEVTLGIPRAGEWAVRWLDAEGRVPYAFAVRTTAVLGDLLLDPPPLSAAGPSPGGRPAPAGSPVTGGAAAGGPPRTIPCLTLPGGRAVLVSYKLRHDPRLRRQVAALGWQFLKFRHLRHLVQEVAAKQLDRYAFQAALGLDPIVEQEGAQLSLW